MLYVYIVYNVYKMCHEQFQKGSFCRDNIADMQPFFRGFNVHRQEQEYCIAHTNLLMLITSRLEY